MDSLHELYVSALAGCNDDVDRLRVHLLYLIYGVVYADNAYDCKRRLGLYLRDCLPPEDTVAVVANAHREHEMGEDSFDTKIAAYPLPFMVVPDMRRATVDEIDHEISGFDKLGGQYTSFAVTCRASVAGSCRSMGIEMPDMLHHVGEPDYTTDVRKFEDFFSINIEDVPDNCDIMEWKLSVVRPVIECLPTEEVLIVGPGSSTIAIPDISTGQRQDHET
jgi:hypothetical protein